MSEFIRLAVRLTKELTIFSTSCSYLPSTLDTDLRVFALRLAFRTLELQGYPGLVGAKRTSWLLFVREAPVLWDGQPPTRSTPLSWCPVLGSLTQREGSSSQNVAAVWPQAS